MTVNVETTRASLDEATQTAGKNREALTTATTVLSQMEAAADRGEEVDAKEFATARADVELKTRRQTILDRAVTAAQRAHTEAKHASVIEGLADRAKKLDDIIDKPLKDLEAAQKAYDASLVQYRDTAAKIMRDAQEANLPTVDVHGDEDGILASVVRAPGYPDRFTNIGIGSGLIRVGGRTVHTTPDQFKLHNREK